MITSRDLAEMSPSSLFVNTSRAGMVEEGALLGALDLGQPGYAAFGVFDAEPMLDPGDRLVRHEDVICTPHIGFVTEDELDRQFAGIYDQVMAYASGQPINVVNPLALTT